MIYILIPIRNRKELTIACLASLKKQTYRDYKFVIVDDGSTDGSGDAIKNLYPEATVIRGDGDWWWTRSMNEGMRFILPQSRPGDFVLTLNDDVEVGPDYLQTLVDISTANKGALVGSIVRNFYDKAWVQDAGVHIDWNKFVFLKLQGTKFQKINNSVDTLACRGLLIPIEVFHAIGTFGRMLPHYSADYIFSIRAKRHGFKLVMSYDATVYSKDRPGDKEFPFWQRYWSRRSSSNVPMQIGLALLGAPTIYLKLKGVTIILARFLRALSLYLLKK